MTRVRLSDRTGPWPSGYELGGLGLPRRRRARSASNDWIWRRGGEPRQAGRSSSAWSAADSLPLFSRSPKKPARAPAHSGWRPMIHEEVSLRLASEELRYPADLFATRDRPDPSGRSRPGPRGGPAAGRLPGLPRTLGIIDLDQGVSQGVFEDAVGRGELAECLEQLGHSRPVADPAQRLGRGSAVRSDWPCRSCISRDTASRSRRRLAEWIAAWRTDSSGSARAPTNDQTSRGMIDPRGGPDGVPPRLGGAVGLERLPLSRDGSVTALVQLLDRPLAHRRAGSSSRSESWSAVIVFHGSFKPRGSSILTASLRRTR